MPEGSCSWRTAQLVEEIAGAFEIPVEFAVPDNAQFDPAQQLYWWPDA